MTRFGDEMPYFSRRLEFYDRIRRESLSDASAFDGPDVELREPGTRTIDPISYLRRASREDVDAFYEAVSDLCSEGSARIANGRVELIREPKRSDRRVDALLDHASAGRRVREIAFGVDGLRGEPELIEIERLPKILRGYVSREDFGDRACAYSRKVVVDDECWAVTYSAFLHERGLEALVSDVGVLHAYAKLKLPPTKRMERMVVRFPYSDERAVLELRDDLWRVPVIVAVGSVLSGDVLIEKYVNIMRADKYVIEGDLELSSFPTE